MSSSKLDNSCEIAKARLGKEILFDNFFPMKVFREQWSMFYFFDSDWIFDAGFVDTAKQLVSNADAECAFLCDLDRLHSQDGHDDSIFIHAETTSDAYEVLLSGLKAKANCWLNRMGRFSCIPDNGEWVLYCERNNEIAVIAFKNEELAMNLLPIVAHFNAAPIRKALESPSFFGMGEAAKSMKWRDQLLQNYKHCEQG